MVGRRIMQGLILMIILCSMTIPANAAWTKKEALQNYAKELASEYYKYDQFAIADIDGNGVPELTLRDQKGEHIHIYGINGNFSGTDNMGGPTGCIAEFGYCPGKNRYVIIINDGFFDNYYYGKITKRTEFNGSDGNKSIFKYFHHAISSKDYYTYTDIEKNITKDLATKDQLNNALKNKIGSTTYTKVPFYANTAANRSKILSYSNGTTAASISLNRSSASIYKSATVQLKATVKGKSSKVTWKSSNKKIATVNSSGKVTGKKAGKVTITAKANGKTAKCTVTVKNPSITLNAKSGTIYTGKTLQLKATVLGKSSKVIWKTSNKKIATVNSSGKVTAKKAGKVTITATANGKKVTCKLTIKKGISRTQAKNALLNYAKRKKMNCCIYDATGNFMYSNINKGGYSFWLRKNNDGKVYKVIIHKTKGTAYGEGVYFYIDIPGDGYLKTTYWFNAYDYI